MSGDCADLPSEAAIIRRTRLDAICLIHYSNILPTKSYLILRRDRMDPSVTTTWLYDLYEP